MIGLDLDDLSVDGSITKARAGARWPGAARSTGASRTVTNRGMLAGSAAPGSFTTTDGPGNPVTAEITAAGISTAVPTAAPTVPPTAPPTGPPMA